MKRIAKSSRNLILMLLALPVVVFFNNCGKGMSALDSSDGGASASEIISAEDVTYQNLKSLIVSNGISSVDELLKNLPNEYKEHFTFVYKSRSLQGASAKNPRAIVFGPSAKLVMTFNGEKSQKGYNNVEILHWNESTNLLELREIQFAENNIELPKFSEANPNKCMQCHSASPKPSGYVKPVMAEYSTWEGFYGSRDDSLFDLPEYITVSNFLTATEVGIVREEFANFMDFKKEVMANPKSRYYDFLNFNTSDEYYPYKVNKNGDYVNTSFDNAPNTRLTDLLYSRHMDQVTTRIKQSKLYDKFKYSISAGLSCGSNFDQKLADRLVNVVNQMPRDNLSRGEEETFNLAPFSPFVGEEILNHFNVVTRDEWDLELGILRDKVESIDYVTPMEKSSAATRILTTVGYPLYSVEVQKTCGPFSETFGVQNPEDLPKDQFIDVSNLIWPSVECANTCEYLTEKAKQEVSNLELELVDRPEVFAGFHLTISVDFTEDDFLGPEYPAVLNRCVGCHSETDVNSQIAPYIPFADRTAVKQWAAKIQQYTDPSLDEVRNGGMAMPFGQMPLTTEERQELLDYVIGN